LPNPSHDYLFSNRDLIFLIDCELTSDGLVAGISSFLAGIEPGDYKIGDNLIKPSYEIRITEDFCSDQDFVFENPTIFKVITKYA